jgi:hypothetical protein
LPNRVPLQKRSPPALMIPLNFQKNEVRPHL